MARLIDELKKLPGVGSKSAQRLALGWAIGCVISIPLGLLMSQVPLVRRAVEPYLHFFRFVPPIAFVSLALIWFGIGETSKVVPIEKTRSYNGVYHVLHGSLSPLHGIGPEHLRLANLSRRIDQGEVDELIIATNPTVEGEATAVYISNMVKKSGVKVTRIATGIPAGSDIEYADEVTMAKALEGRREL